jgi:glycine oxidase
MESVRSRPSRVAIIGAGAIGLAIGWRLARAGLSVTIVERAAPGRGATWAAGGMLAAAIETEPTEEVLFQLGRWSQSLWPGFAAALEAASGMALGYWETGTLACAFTRDQAARLRQNLAIQHRAGCRLEWLSAAAARELEPGLSPNLVGAVLSPEDHEVDNRLLVQALEIAFTRAGGTLLAGAEPRIVPGEGVVVAGDLLPAETIVVAAGAWSRTVEGLPETARPPVRPIKGQMLSVRMPAENPLIRRVVWGGNCYLIPRGDGRLLVGATTEERGFEPSLTAGGVLGLLDDAWRTLPGIEELPIEEMWTGFRPGSPDDMPILGESGVEGLLLATGHHRNGILLAPATAELIAERVLTGRVPERMAPFARERFRVAA